MRYTLALFLPHPLALFRFCGKFLGIEYALLPNREWNQKQKHKKQPWGNVECFAFGGATVRKRVSMPPTTHFLRHPLTRAIHFAPRLFFMFLFQSRQYLTTEPLFFDADGGVFEWHDFAIHGEAASVERGGNVGCGTVAIVRNGDLHIHIGI